MRPLDGYVQVAVECTCTDLKLEKSIVSWKKQLQENIAQLYLGFVLCLRQGLTLQLRLVLNSW